MKSYAVKNSSGKVLCYIAANNAEWAVTVAVSYYGYKNATSAS